MTSERAKRAAAVALEVFGARCTRAAQRFESGTQDNTNDPERWRSYVPGLHYAAKMAQATAGELRARGAMDAAAALLRSEPVGEHPSVGFYRRLLAFYEPRSAMEWMLAPHMAFRSGEPPREVSAMDMIFFGRAAEVDAEIQRLETGAYV